MNRDEARESLDLPAASLTIEGIAEGSDAMTPTAIEVGGLALIVGILAFAQRLGGWENKLLARCLGITAAGLFVVWCFLCFPAWCGWAAAVVVALACLGMIVFWVRKPSDRAGNATGVNRGSRRKYPHPKLEFGLIHGVNLPSDRMEAFRECLVVDIKNTQTTIANRARNLTARIQFVHTDGSTFTVTSAAWLIRKGGNRGATNETISSSADLEGGEEQPFVLLLVRKDGSLVAFRNLDVPVGECGIGHWTAQVRIVSENAPMIEASIGFTVFRGSPFQFDQPTAFLARTDR